LLPAFEAPDWILRVIILLVGIGFVLALILSWAFELTPQGVVRTEDVPVSESVTIATGQKLNTLIIGALVLVLGFVVVDNYVLDGPEQEVVASDVAPPAEETTEVLPNSVAVLLCDNLSPNPDDAYFAASIHEEILNQLVKISSMNVIARTSVLQYADASLPIPQIAAELNVGAVMECSVRFAGTAIMVTAQLIDPVTNSHLWSDTYPGDLSDLSAIFAMQADIAMNIANALQVEFSSDEAARIGKQATVSAEAYTLYLKAVSGGVVVSTHIPSLDAAIALDPEFALAHAAKALAIARQLSFGMDITAEREQLAIQSAETALTLDPEVGLAYSALGIIHQLNWRRVAANEAYEKAIEVSPRDADILSSYATVKRNAGDYPAAIQFGRTATSLDPNNAGLWHQLGVTYLHARNNEAAFAALQNALALVPGLGPSIFELGNYHLARGEKVQAAQAFRTLEASGSFRDVAFLRALVAIGFERAGLQSDAYRVFENVRALVGEDSTGNISLAIAYIAAHEYDKAYDELDRAIAGSVPLELSATVELKLNRWEHPVLNEPRFVELRNKLGFQD
jgi:TolB-like protein/Tfp pilus assembly protein PilF